MKNTVYLQRLKPIIGELSQRNNLGEGEIGEIIDHFFTTFKKFITDPRMPTIKISNFGTFKPSIGKLDWQIKNAEYHLRQDKLPKDKLLNKISKLEIIKDRLNKESDGGDTWKEWRNKELEDNAKK